MVRLKTCRLILIPLLMIAAALLAVSLRAEPPAVNPAAVQILKNMTDYFSKLEQFSVHTQNTLEDQLDSGQRIDYDVAASVMVRRPNKIRADRKGEEVSQVFYYDGKSLTLYDPVENVYATEQAPKTIEELLDYTRESLGLVIPASDLVYRNAFAILMQGVTSAVIVGTAKIGEVTCQHLAFKRADVDFQVWVAVDDKPLPCKYVVTDTSTPALISTVTVMSDWDFTPVNDEEFVFKPPESALEIPFIPLDKIQAFGN